MKRTLPRVNCVLSDENRRWLEEKIRFEQSPEARVLVEYEPEQWHPGIEGLLTAHLEAVAGKGSAATYMQPDALEALRALSPRQLAIYNALMRAADVRGCEAWLDLKSVELNLSFGRGPVTIVIRRQKERPEGSEERQRMRVSSEFSAPLSPRDTDRSSIEDRLDEVFERVCTAEIEGRERKLKPTPPEKSEKIFAMMAGWERERAEAKLANADLPSPVAPTDLTPSISPAPISAAEPAPAVAPISTSAPQPIPEAARPAAESARCHELIDEAARWHQSQQIRDYAAFIGSATGKASEWVKWATSIADSLNPAPLRIARLGGGDGLPPQP